MRQRQVAVRCWPIRDTSKGPAKSYQVRARPSSYERMRVCDRTLRAIRVEMRFIWQTVTLIYQRSTYDNDDDIFGIWPRHESRDCALAIIRAIILLASLCVASEKQQSPLKVVERPRSNERNGKKDFSLLVDVWIRSVRYFASILLLELELERVRERERERERERDLTR